MKTIFRIEHKEGGGLYLRGQSYDDERKCFMRILDDLGLDPFDEHAHPMPMSDPALKFTTTFGEPDKPGLHFGFGSIDQLKGWTINENVRQALTDNGFIIKEFTVANANAQIGRAQAVFYVDRAKLVKTFSVSDVDNSELMSYNGYIN